MKAVSDIQENSKMKKIVLFLVSTIIAAFILQGCNKRIIPTAGGKQFIKTFDSSAFDYIFIEALKQKFLGNPGDALKYFEQCIKINPKSDASYFEMAKIALMLSDLENGKKLALKAWSLNERNIWYLLLVGNIYYQEKNLDSTIIFYEKAVNYFPEKENVKLNLANMYSEKGLYEKAGVILNYFEMKYGVNEGTSVSMINNLINSGDFNKAKEKIKLLLINNPDEILYNGLLAEVYRANGEIEKAEDAYIKLMELDQDNPQTLLSLSDFLISEKLYKDLFSIINKIILSDNISKEQKRALFVRIVNDSNLIKVNARDVELSLIILETYSKNDDLIVLLRPELYQNQKNISKAIMRIEEIIKERPDNYYAWERLLLLYSDIKDWNNLFEKGKECATRFNRSFLAKVLYANAALEKGQLTIAEEELKKARILAGDDSEMQVQILIMEADVFYRRKELKKSFDLYKEALKIKPEDILVLNNYAYYLAEQGQNLKEAEKMAKTVVDKEKGNATYLDTYAWILYKRNRYREAQKIMEKVIANEEIPNAEWYEHLGYIMKAVGKCDKAREYWKLAIKYDSLKNSLLKEIENCKNR